MGGNHKNFQMLHELIGSIEKEYLKIPLFIIFYLFSPIPYFLIFQTPFAIQSIPIYFIIWLIKIDSLNFIAFIFFAPILPFFQAIFLNLDYDLKPSEKLFLLKFWKNGCCENMCNLLESLICCWSIMLFQNLIIFAIIYLTTN